MTEVCVDHTQTQAQTHTHTHTHTLTHTHTHTHTHTQLTQHGPNTATGARYRLAAPAAPAFGVMCSAVPQRCTAAKPPSFRARCCRKN